MPTAVPSPQTTLLVLLGASEWPYSPEFPQSHAFTNAARRLEDYFVDQQTFGLPRENLLDLFDSDHSADDIDQEIEQFLEQRLSRMKEVGFAARDLVVYFVGHGGFAGGDAEYYLAIRRTRAANPTASGIRIVSLAHTLKEQARYLRRIVILDCCFAGAAFRAFQAAPAQAAITQTLEAFRVPGKGEGIPGRGTSLLCSSRHNRPSLLLPDGSSTMFSQALLEALVTGNPYQQGPLSLQDVASLAEDVLRTLASGDAPRPEIHSPDQSEGDIAQLPFFPNLAARATRTPANFETSPVVEMPQPIIRRQPSQARADPPYMQTQQHHPSNAGPESTLSTDAIAQNQSPSSQHTVFVSGTLSPPTPTLPETEMVPAPLRIKWKTRVTKRTLLSAGVALVVLIASVVGFFALGPYQTTLSATHATATASWSTMLASQSTGTAEVGTQATVSAQLTVTASFTNPYDDHTLKTLFLNDKLNKNSDSGWDETSGKCSFTSQGYHVTDLTQALTLQVCIARTTYFSDLIFQVRMNILKGSGGILFRFMDSAGYYFRISRNGYYALFACAGAEASCTSPLVNAFSSYINTKPNQLNLIAVVAIADHIKLYINNVNVNEKIDNKAVRGQIGVVADVNSEVVFSNAEVWSS